MTSSRPWGELSVKEKLKLLHQAMADYDDQAPAGARWNYHLVMTNITMENHIFLIGKPR